VDGKSVLSCHGGAYAVAATCPGEGGCSIANHQVDCDLGKKEDDKKKGK
jgi:hypothetical protein